MRLVTYQYHTQSRIGAIVGDKIVDVQRAYKAYCLSMDIPFTRAKQLIPRSMLAFLKCGQDGLQIARQGIEHITQRLNCGDRSLRRKQIIFNHDEITLLAPIPRPGKVICVAANFPAALNAPRPEFPILFLKPSSTVAAPGCPVLLPEIAENVAPEVELTLVIGQQVSQVTPEDALSPIFGYTLANDLGDRTLEKRTSQWTTGKMMDNFTPMGPAIVSADEIPNPNSLELITYLNGELVQKGNTKDMFFNVAELVSYISMLTTLEPGDVILTGSPKLLGDTLSPTVILKPGDMIEVNIAGIGRLANPIGRKE